MNTWQIGDPLYAASAWTHLSRTTRTHLAMTKTRTGTCVIFHIKSQCTTIKKVSKRDPCRERFYVFDPSLAGVQAYRVWSII